MNTNRNPQTLSSTVTLEEHELSKINREYPVYVAKLFAQRYVEENYDKLIKDKQFLEKAREDAQGIISQHIAKRVIETFDAGLEKKK